MARRNLLHQFTRNDNERLVHHVPDDRSMAHDEHILEQKQALDFPVDQRATILPPVTETSLGHRELWAINGQNFNKSDYSREQAQTEYINQVSALHDTSALLQHSIFSAPVDEAKRHLDLHQGADYISPRLLRMHAALSSEE
jgi:hypothetical protein